MTLPRMCYFIPQDSYVEGEGYRVSMVTEGVAGHTPTGTWPCSPSDVRPYFWGHDYADALRRAELQNTRMGLTSDDVSDIIASSMAVPTKRLSLDPNLTDGTYRTIHDKPDDALLELITLWMEGAEPGEEFTISLVEMSQADADALPQV